MSVKIITAFMLAFFLLSTLTYLAEGSGELQVTRLSQPLAEGATTANVDSTQGFSATGIIVIAEEEIYYNGINTDQFLNLQRGQNDTNTNSYENRSKVYSESASTMAHAMSADFAEMASNSGWVGIFMIPKTFFFDVVPSLVMWDFSILKEGPMQWFRMVLFCFSAGFILYIIWIVAHILSGIARSIILPRA